MVSCLTLKSLFLYLSLILQLFFLKHKEIFMCFTINHKHKHWTGERGEGKIFKNLDVFPFGDLCSPTIFVLLRF